MIFSKSASKISIILRHQVKVVKSAENEEVLGIKFIFVKISKFSDFHDFLLNLAESRPRAKGLLGDRTFHWSWEVFHENFEISWKFVIFMQFQGFHDLYFSLNFIQYLFYYRSPNIDYWSLNNLQTINPSFLENFSFVLF